MCAFEAGNSAWQPYLFLNRLIDLVLHGAILRIIRGQVELRTVRNRRIAAVLNR